MVTALLPTACTSASQEQDAASSASSGSAATAIDAGSVTPDPVPTPTDSVQVVSTGGTVSSNGVTVEVPGGAFANEAVTVQTGVPIGVVQGTFAAELFGAPVGVDHDVAATQPVTISWTVPGLSDAQRATLTLAHWDETIKAWQPSEVQPIWSGDTLTAQVTDFSFWDWITDIGQTTGEWTGSRADPPTCSTDPMPSWVKGTVSPSEDLSAAAIQVCFEADKNERATVRVTNNRTFSQVMQADGIPKWAWTWDGPEDYGVAGAVYSVGHTVS